MNRRSQRNAAQFAQEQPGSGETQPDDDQPPDAGGDRNQQKRPQPGMLGCLDGINFVRDAADWSHTGGPDTKLTVVAFGTLEHGGGDERELGCGAGGSGGGGGAGQ